VREINDNKLGNNIRKKSWIVDEIPSCISTCLLILLSCCGLMEVCCGFNGGRKSCGEDELEYES